MRRITDVVIVHVTLDMLPPANVNITTDDVGRRLSVDLAASTLHDRWIGAAVDAQRALDLCRELIAALHNVERCAWRVLLTVVDFNGERTERTVG